MTPQVLGTFPRTRTDLLGGRRRSDGDIAATATQVLECDGLVSTEPVLATVSKGRVTLWGDVGRPCQRRRAERAVADLPGVQGVVNLIMVRRPGSARRLPA